MKAYILILALFSFSACQMIVFEQPQPQNGKQLSEFPENFRGEYLIEGESAIIIYKDSLELIDSANTAYALSDSLILIEKWNKYFLNVAIDGYWYIFQCVPFAMDSIQTTVIPLKNNMDSVSFKKLKRICPPEKHDDYWVLSPSKRQFKKLTKKMFIEKKSTLVRVK